VIYNTSTGELFFDADGSGSSAAQLIATLQSAAVLVATDIEVINGSAPGGQVINGTAGNDSLVGGADNDTLQGLGGSDTLNGAGGDDWLEGGTGQDNLTGGAGADSFVFRDTPFNTNYDRVFNFASGTDELVLDSDAYTSIGALGGFSAGDGRFFAAAGAVSGHDADDRIIYNTSNGTLHYDADGSGGGREMFIGVLHGAPALDATDIAII
jgi:Ca2+-binding RTX toxin-like protein